MTGIRVHPVAGKCGVFAETDINSLQKQGIPPEELMASLFEAFVLQNLKVLARGHTLLPHVLLLGGPNAFIPGMREAWQHNIALMWEERGVPIPEGDNAGGADPRAPGCRVLRRAGRCGVRQGRRYRCRPLLRAFAA